MPVPRRAIVASAAYVAALALVVQILVSMSLYSALEVTPAEVAIDSSLLKKAYHRLSLVHHPDKVAAGEDKADHEATFFAMRSAMDTLGKERSRKLYDSYGYVRDESDPRVYSEDDVRATRNGYAAITYAVFALLYLIFLRRPLHWFFFLVLLAGMASYETSRTNVGKHTVFSQFLPGLTQHDGALAMRSMLFITLCFLYALLPPRKPAAEAAVAAALGDQTEETRALKQRVADLERLTTHLTSRLMAVERDLYPAEE